MQIQVSELIVRYMEKLGIDTIFGMPGAHILPVYDSLYDSPIRSVLAKHEQGAAFMACGYSRASGRIGACITTAGPGATNLVTGIANAYADKQPVLVITGETPTYVFGKGGLQESSGEGGSIDQSALFDSITRYSRVIERTDYLANVLNQASRILLSENAGPVLLSLPYNVQKEMVDPAILDQVYFGNGARQNKAVAANAPVQQPQQIQQFADLITASSQPVIISGYGCIRSGAQDAIARLSEKFNIPVCSSLKGKGSIDESSPLSLGSLGVTSSGYAYDYIVNRADLIVVLGASFNERTSYLWNESLLADKQVIQVDINEEHLNKVFQADLCLHADIRQTIDAVLDNINGAAVDRKQLDDIGEYKNRIELRASEKGEAIFQAEFSLVKAFFEKMNGRFPEGISVFDDNIIFAQNLLEVSGNYRFYPNAGISSLGHAIPAAIGAQFAERTTMFAIIGDGGFQMCCMELMTAVNYNIPLSVILFNNSSMGLIRKNQIQSYNNRFIDCDFTNPDYGKLAESFGINHVRIQSEDELDPMFSNTDFHHAINLIEIVIDKNAFPNYSSRR
ncbi:MAG TPA: thiamine pyrophosphate-binding protein [Gammaproteobacteria bacterium]|nr:thiamine pyrophosphate-binding protein [Gammaproteobacteria bacterium]